MAQKRKKKKEEEKNFHFTGKTTHCNQAEEVNKTGGYAHNNFAFKVRTTFAKNRFFSHRVETKGAYPLKTT